jgi:hypothetical protein
MEFPLALDRIVAGWSEKRVGLVIEIEFKEFKLIFNRPSAFFVSTKLRIN